jgi:phosphatidylcholine synthase
MTKRREFIRRVAAWLVHCFTGTGAILGLFMLNAILTREYLHLFWFMVFAIAIDAMDGVLARKAQTRVYASRIDGTLLDNLVDYLNYAIIPAFFLTQSNLLPEGWNIFAASTIVMASAYQFTQTDAKTDDHFFKGFPSYWNIVAFYLFLWNIPPWANASIILILSILVFIPVKYVYPSRLDFISHNPWARKAMLLATIGWGIATIALLWLYPKSNPFLMGLSIAYIILYAAVSVCGSLGCMRLWRPRES